MININDKTTDDKLTNLDGETPPSEATKLRHGYRHEPAVPEIADGYTRISIKLIEGDGLVGQWECVDRLTSEIEAEQAAAQTAAAAAEVVRLATPLIFDQPIQARIEIPYAPDHAYRLAIDPIAGEVIPVEIESVRLTEAEWDAAHAATLATKATRRSRIDALENDLLTIDTAVDEMMAVDLSATGTLGVAIAATTGVNKTALTAMRNALIDVRAKAKKGLNNSRQACEKLRKEVR